MADNRCGGCGRDMRGRPNDVCPTPAHWQAWHEVDLRAAYERGVREAAAAAVVAGGSYSPALKRAKQRILALLDKEGGGDG